MGLTTDNLPIAKISHLISKHQHTVSPYQIAVGCTCVGVGVAYAFSSDREKGKVRAQRVVKFMTHKVIPKVKRETERRERENYESRTSQASQASQASYYSQGGSYEQYQHGDGGHSRQNSGMSMEWGQQVPPPPPPPPPPGSPPVSQGGQYLPMPSPQGQYYSQDGEQQYASWNSKVAPPPAPPAAGPLEMEMEQEKRKDGPSEKVASPDVGSAVTTPSENEAQ